MTKKKVWRYYCEFCRKAGCSGGHIAAHERSCTANPNRVCVMHKHCEHPQRPIDELMGVLRSHAADKQWRQATEDLRQAASGCPACMLAAIRQSGMQGITSDSDGVDFGADFEFDFREELKAFWADVNHRQACQETYG